MYERFLSPLRLCYPDFDIDYDYERLDEVINHLKEKYGSGSVIRIISYGRLKCWQSLKIAGKYLNYADEEIEHIKTIIVNNYNPRLSLSSLLNSNSYMNKYGIPHWDGVKLLGFFRDKKNDKLIKIACCLESVKCNKGLRFFRRSDRQHCPQNCDVTGERPEISEIHEMCRNEKIESSECSRHIGFEL